jgi:hypothetical protein
MEDLVAAALEYAGRWRWRVIPLHTNHAGRCTCGRASCHTPAKHPRLKGWPAQATTDPQVIAQWWSWWPEANVGIATGAGLLVPDIDGDVGAESLAALEREYGLLPDTPRSITGGGGYHYLLRADVPIRNAVGLRPGVDIRADGALIVAPPSLHISGRRYCWDVTADPAVVPVAPAPRWLLDLVCTTAKARAASTTPGSELHLVRGERNDRLYRLACGWRAKGIGRTALLEMLQVVNRHHADPPLLDDELEKIATSAAKHDPAVDVAIDALDALLAHGKE